ncbi:MAG: MgtC/SapB family protein [Candidatus Binataceae bacterium]
MADFSGTNSPVIGFLVALAIGLLIGRTREPAEGMPPRPGLRDFVIIALLGALAGYIGNTALTVALLVAAIGTILAMRAQHRERTGITTELAATATFALAMLAVTPHREIAAAMGIVLAMVLARREELRRLVREEISDQEYIDTLSFLGIVFIVYPLLPAGNYGPFGFIEPRRIWLFVILVSGVSFVGYFLAKFTGAARGAMLTAVVGALASTTAYTTGISEAVKDAPDSAVPAARYALISNSIMFPKMLVIVAPICPALAIAGIPSFTVMTTAGFAAAWLLARQPPHGRAPVAASAFPNPFMLGPALKFGVVFTGVLFLTRAAHNYLGVGGQMAVSAISGLVDVNAISLTLAGFVQGGTSTARNAVIGMTLAAGVNAVFKSAIARSSGQSAFYLRIAAGFAIMFAAGAVALLLMGATGFAAAVGEIAM